MAKTTSKNTRYSLNKNKYLSKSEFENFKDLLKSHLNRDTRNCTLLYLAIHTGARATEILNLTFDDLDHDHQSLYIKGLKGSNDREIPLPAWLFGRLEDVVKSRQVIEQAKDLNNQDPRIFPISYNRLRQVWEFYRPTHKKFHALRHTFAIELYKKTKDIRLLQVALGHRNITNTMIYADYVYSQQELRKLIVL